MYVVKVMRSFLNVMNYSVTCKSIMGRSNLEMKAMDGASSLKKKSRKKRAASDLDHELALSGDIAINAGDNEAIGKPHIEDDLNEPTMGEKLASLNIIDDNNNNDLLKEERSLDAKPPSADSVHVLIKQALHVDDRSSLMELLVYPRRKGWPYVIANSISQLNPSDVIKLLHFLISILQSRGAVLACALPWLRSLLLQHASGIMAQESSLRVLNSLYQLIESRVSTFQSALQLSSCMDYLFVEISDDMDDEMSIIPPIIYKDKDESEDESEGDTEDDQESEGEEVVNSISDLDSSEDDDEISESE
ncbi:hypothetical protein GIB67_025375 [Kingdonia uniflora]|uniref:Small-subunit processome Utp12 domain-containing protein n=1 Tax=Kingdonia uniflora TaxID=39325 RepID=A0A7J7NBB1_9MAGN|nr:hypothetical protein GIB67_025375 [Kingdonia uniflora]